MKFELTAGAYKSIASPFSWDDIPQFAILTGENGSGKTQLLQIMYQHIDAKMRANLQREYPGLNASFSEPSFEAHEVLFLQDFSKPQNTPIVGLNDTSSDLVNLISGIANKRSTEDPFEKKRILRIREEVEKRKIELTKLDEDTIYPILPKGFSFWNPNQLYRDVAFHLFNYHLDTITMKADGQNYETIIKKLGPPPWETLNELFEQSSLRYRLQTPKGKNVRSKYQMALVDVETGKEILTQDLSSGEIALLRLYLWLFIAKNKFTFPKLVLLDEPDSHLEPALIHDFIKALKSGLVDGLGAHVIMSTHRMETVVFAPPDSVYEMHARPARVEKSSDRGKTISLLTQNLITIVGDKRPVFVEDEDDARFYNVIFGLYEDENQKKQLVFLPASIGKSKTRDSGGSDKVIQWVEKLHSAGLYPIVKGIIDGDNKKIEKKGIFALDRYSIENYLLDPLVIYAVLLDNHQQPSLELSCEIEIGGEYKIRDFSDEDMQTITNYITSELAQKLRPPLEETPFEIKYTNDKNISVPQWLIERKGHDLMAAANGKWPVVHFKSLLKALEKVRLLPVELRVLFEKVLS